VTKSREPTPIVPMKLVPNSKRSPSRSNSSASAAGLRSKAIPPPARMKGDNRCQVRSPVRVIRSRPSAVPMSTSASPTLGSPMTLAGLMTSRMPVIQADTTSKPRGPERSMPHRPPNSNPPPGPKAKRPFAMDEVPAKSPTSCDVSTKRKGDGMVWPRARPGIETSSAATARPRQVVRTRMGGRNSSPGSVSD